ESLVGLLQSWSDFASTQNLPWWIAHGALIGWFWNARLLPWDADLDIQVPTRTLLRLLPHNNTLHAPDARYLLDVNPHVVHRSPQTNNTIDARWIDTWTGYMIDITGLTQYASTGRMHCKTPHPYSIAQLMPLHETWVEGVRVWRPRDVVGILVEEYGEQSLI
ncbi:hypothetical protein BC830DRAFT_1042885, partial [Chytriomyces sp. MP71]